MSSWRTKLKKTRTLKHKGLALIYERVKLYRDIFNDEAFHDACATEGSDPTEKLSLEVADLPCADIGVYFSLLDEFPDKSHWQDTTLERMIATIQEQARQQREAQRRQIERSHPEAIRGPTSRADATQGDDSQDTLASRVSTKDYRELYESLKTKYDQTRQQLKAARARIKELENLLPTAEVA